MTSTTRRLSTISAVLGLAALGMAAAPGSAHAWRGEFGVFLPPIVVAPGPAYVAAPTYYVPPPVYVAPTQYVYAAPQRVWLPGHWEYGYYVPGHWS